MSRLDVNTALQEKGECRFVAAQSCLVQSGPAVRPLGVDLRAPLQEQPDHSPVALGTRNAHRSVTLHVCSADLGAACQQN